MTPHSPSLLYLSPLYSLSLSQVTSTCILQTPALCHTEHLWGCQRDTLPTSAHPTRSPVPRPAAQAAEVPASPSSLTNPPSLPTSPTHPPPTLATPTVPVRRSSRDRISRTPCSSHSRPTSPGSHLTLLATCPRQLRPTLPSPRDPVALRDKRLVQLPSPAPQSPSLRRHKGSSRPVTPSSNSQRTLRRVGTPTPLITPNEHCTPSQHL